MPRGSSGKSLVRVVRLFRAFVDYRCGLTLGEIGEELGVSRRQAYRYLAAFEAAGLHLGRDTTMEGRSRWRLLSRREFVA